MHEVISTSIQYTVTYLLMQICRYFILDRVINIRTSLRISEKKRDTPTTVVINAVILTKKSIHIHWYTDHKSGILIHNSFSPG